MPLRQASALGAPERFGKYELLGVVGKGGMAEVFLARATGPMGFARELVIKRILPHLSSDEDFVEMFVAEAKLSGALSHGNIVPIFEFGEVDGQLFLAMEYVDGSDLRALFRRKRLEGERLPPEVAVHVAVEVLKGLGYAHARRGADGQPLGIVHRDVSPSNILVSRAGEVKLCDFGIAKAATRHTSSGRLKGKFSYMSPEQARGKPLDARSDLFSVGIILWEMLSGARLFQGDSDLSVLDQVREAQIAELPPLGIAGEERLREVVHRALQVDPAQRFPDAASFAAPLRAFLAGVHDVDPARELERVVAAQAGDSARPSATPETTPASGIVPRQEAPEGDAAPPAVVAPAPSTPEPLLAAAETELHARTQSDVSLRLTPWWRTTERLVALIVFGVIVVAGVIVAIVVSGRRDAPAPHITATPLGTSAASVPGLPAPLPAPRVPPVTPPALAAPSPVPATAPAAASAEPPRVALPPPPPPPRAAASAERRTPAHPAPPRASAPTPAAASTPSTPRREPGTAPAATKAAPAAAPTRPVPPPVRTVDPFALDRR